MNVLDNLKAMYAELCAERDRRNALNVDLQRELDEVNALAEKARLRAMELAAQIEKNWGGAEWIEMKKQIGLLAKALSKPDGKEKATEATEAAEPTA